MARETDGFIFRSWLYTPNDQVVEKYLCFTKRGFEQVSVVSASCRRTRALYSGILLGGGSHVSYP